MKTLFSLFLFLFIATNSYAAFTVDSRSLLHLGYSGLFGSGVDTIAYHGIHQWDEGDRLLAATIIGSIPNTVKETMIDAYIDYGDLFMGPVGAFIGGYASEKINKKYFGKSKYEIYVLIDKNSIMIAGTW